MAKAKRARTAETPKQPSLRLTLRAPYLYPDRAYSATAVMGELLNHLVGGGEDAWRNREAERLRSPDVDHQLELCWLQDGKVRRTCAVENSANVDAGLARRLRDAGSVTHQTTH